MKAGRGAGSEEEIFGWHRQINGREFEKFQYIMKDNEAWSPAVHGAAKSWA